MLYTFSSQALHILIPQRLVSEHDAQEQPILQIVANFIQLNS